MVKLAEKRNAASDAESAETADEAQARDAIVEAQINKIRLRCVNSILTDVLNKLGSEPELVAHNAALLAKAAATTATA